MAIRSRYRIIPLLLLYILTIGWSWISGFIIYLSVKEPTFITEMLVGAMIFVSMILLVELMLLHQFFIDSRRVKVDNKGIVFIHPLFPFIRRRYKWRNLNYHLTVLSYAKYGGVYENTWLIRKGRVRARISSFYYANYMEIKDALCIPDQGERKLNWFRNFACNYGWTKVPRYYSRYRS